MTGRLAFNPGGNLPALLLIESGRLKAECGQHRPGALTASRFFLCPATKSATPQVLRQKKPLNRQEAEVRAAE
jgi:hypothetical protein